MEITFAAPDTSAFAQNWPPLTSRVSGSHVRMLVTGVVVSMKSGR